jgi:4a-hydroxytetrahydrobiopterin dehydratase
MLSREPSHLTSAYECFTRGWRPRRGDGGRSRPVAELLSDIGIQRELGALPGWSRRGDSLTKTYRFPTFPSGITFVTRVADVAESMNHHPDIDIRHTRLTFTLSTHDAGGITTNDLSLAREIERLATESGV